MTRVGTIDPIGLMDGAVPFDAGANVVLHGTGEVAHEPAHIEITIITVERRNPAMPPPRPGVQLARHLLGAIRSRVASKNGSFSLPRPR